MRFFNKKKATKMKFLASYTMTCDIFFCIVQIIINNASKKISHFIQSKEIRMENIYKNIKSFQFQIHSECYINHDDQNLNEYRSVNQ